MKCVRDGKPIVDLGLSILFWFQGLILYLVRVQRERMVDLCV